MWKNPNRVLDIYMPTLVHSLIKGECWTCAFPQAEDIFSPEFDAAERMDEELNFLTHHYAAISKLISPTLRIIQAPAQRQQAAKKAGRHIMTLAQTMVADRQWELLTRLYATQQILQVTHGEQRCIQDFLTYFLCSLHLLMGSETEMLVGTRGNMAAWLPWELSKSKDLSNFLPLIGAEMRYIDSNDLSFLPRQGEWLAMLELDEVSMPQVDSAYIRIADLFEDAYYNQRYLPHPEGSIVKIEGIPHLEQVVIKTKRSLGDPHYLDFFGVFTVNGKKFFRVLSGSGIHARYADAEVARVTDFLAGDLKEVMHWVLAQVYHDLVTAIEIPPGSKRFNQSLNTVGCSKQPDDREPTISWVYIPRKVREGEAPIRREAATVRSMSPHRVSGYKRKGRMTEKHRDALLEFERTTGIEVLRWMPEGFTFVRPYISPKDGSETLLGLPMFIRAKIQHALKQLLRTPE